MQHILLCFCVIAICINEWVTGIFVFNSIEFLQKVERMCIWFWNLHKSNITFEIWMVQGTAIRELLSYICFQLYFWFFDKRVPFVALIVDRGFCVVVTHWLIGLVGRVFATGLGDLGSIPSYVMPKTLKIVFDTSLLNTQQYKVHIKGKVERSWERNSALS